MEIISHRRHAVNITQMERILSAVTGSILAVAGLRGLRRKTARGVAMAAVGGDLIRRGITGHSYLFEAMGIRTAPLGQGWQTTSVPYELGIRVDRAVTIHRPRPEVFRFWRDLRNLPTFMTHVESISLTGDNRSHWVVKAPAGRRVEWAAVIHNEIENELIAWRTLPGADVDHAGSVRFKDAPGGNGTEIQVELQYNPPAGTFGAVFANLWGEEPTQQIEADLRRLKEVLESSQVPATEVTVK